MDHTIHRVEPAHVRPTAPHRRRHREEDAAFELASEGEGGESERESTPEPEAPAAERSVAPRAEDEPGAHLDLSA